MKHIYWVLFSLLLIARMSPAENVSLPDAGRVARNFYYERVNQYYPVAYDLIKIHDTYVCEEKGNPLLYIFNFENKGYVIVSAQDATYPVLGYSFEGNYQKGNSPANLEAWLAFYQRQISYASTADLSASQNIHSEWKRLLESGPQELKIYGGQKSVLPMLTSQWNQDRYYNDMCPSDSAGPGGHAYAGCVATAMGQLMYYFRWPDQGVGSYTYYHPVYDTLTADFGNTTYQWDKMSDAIGSPNDAIAQLLFHLGVSVDMDYGPDGSGMWNHKAAYSLSTYFKYSPQTQYVFRDSTLLNWDSLLITHLDKKIPMYYAGWAGVGSTNGHAFICDGYQDSLFYHFNWGWSGLYDGYFYTDNLVPGGGNFNFAQELIINCYPDTVNYEYPTYCNGETILMSTSGSFEDNSGPGDYQNNSSCSWLIAPDDPEQDSVSYISLNFSRFHIDTTDVVTVYDGKDTSAAIIGSFSGNSLPSDITSTGNKLFVTFFSDGMNTADGFHANFVSHFPKFCSGITTLTQATDTLSDGSGAYHYNNNALCRWKITPQGASWVTLTFTAFDTEPNKDLVKIYDLANNTLLATYSGNEIPSPVTSPSGKMFIIFVTDDDNTAQGWEAYYTSSTVGNKDNDPISDNLVLSPNPASSFLNVKFQNDDHKNIRLEVLDMYGKVVVSEKIPSSIKHYNQNLDVSHLPKGIYIFRKMAKNDVTQQKFVVQ